MKSIHTPISNIVLDIDLGNSGEGIWENHSKWIFVTNNWDAIFETEDFRISMHIVNGIIPSFQTMQYGILLYTAIPLGLLITCNFSPFHEIISPQARSRWGFYLFLLNLFIIFLAKGDNFEWTFLFWRAFIVLLIPWCCLVCVGKCVEVE